MKKKEARPASPPVVPVEAAPILRILHYSIIFLLDPWVICKILSCNLSRYCICSPYCYYTCYLNILATRIEASVSSSQNWGVTKMKLTRRIREYIVKGVISSVIRSCLQGEDDVGSGSYRGAGSRPLRL
jgi:hypothetical protein